MAVAMVVAGGAFTGITFLANTLVDKLVPSNDGSNFGEETLNDSTIEDEEKNNRSATFFFDFENGSTTLIIIIIGGIVTLVLAMGCCIFFCGCSRFGSRFCCRKANSTRGEELYREKFYELQCQVYTPAKIIEMRSTQDQCQVNNPAKIIEMRSTQDVTSTEHNDRYELYKKHWYADKNRMNNEIYEYPKFEDNEHKNEDNGRQEQNDNKIEEIVQLPNVDQTQYTVISEKNKKTNRATDKDKGVHAKNQKSKNKKKNHTTDYGNRTSKLVQKITDDTDGTDSADDTDSTDDTVKSEKN